jgi:NAD(P)-dependent dehydrogenase (short-subunit alcohol dehydrogenase family)
MTTVLITGASRGLGLEFTRQYATDGCDVIATCRHPAAATALAEVARAAGARTHVEQLDVTDHAAVDGLAEKYRGTPVDILINNAGEIGPRDPGLTRLPEQLFGTMNYAAWRRVLEVNTLAPLKVAEAFAGHVAASAQKKMIFISSATGSNAEGKHVVIAYCSSKAALNKVVTMLAMTLKDRGLICAALCPGHVKTNLGGDGATLTPAQSVAGLRRVIAGLTPADSGCYRDQTGTTVGW